MAMPFEEHPSFELPPDRGQTIWRYLTLPKLIDVLESSQLFFSRVDLLGDPLEGSYPALNPMLRAIQSRKFMPATDKGQESAKRLTEMMSTIHEQWRFRVAVNCWRQDEHESVAMWKLYANETEGVAIKSTIKRLCDSMAGAPQHVHVGRVRYIDYQSDVIIEGNLFAPFMHKRRSFDYEREVRAALTFGVTGPEDLLDVGRLPAETGVLVPVDVSTLVSGIVVSPAAADWFLRVVTSVLMRMAPGLAVTRSSMSSPAIY